jgi:Tfp pilus assembly PilM family ATPase
MYSSVSLERERFVVMSVANGKITGLDSRELVHPFHLVSFQDDARDLEVHRDTLENLIQKSGIAGHEVGVVIGEHMVQLKKIPVAMGLDATELKDQMMWEAEQVLLSPVKGFRMFYQRLPSKTQNGNPYYLQILIRKNVLKSIHALVESAGIFLHEVEIDIFSSLRALQMNYSFDPEDIITLLQVQESGLLFTITHQGDYFLSHRVALPKVETITTSDLADLITKELRRLVFGHRLGQDIGDLKKLYILGNGSVDDLMKTLSGDFPIPVEKMNPLKRIQVAPELRESQEVLRNSNRYAATVGLLLKNHPKLLKA